MVLACGECTPMLSWLFLGLSLHLNNGLAANERHTGVNPSLISKYTPLSGDLASWRCLDGSKIIPWSSVNDDYCDCADGSDEPGNILLLSQMATIPHKFFQRNERMP